jgi:hypothetical protein
MKNISIFIIVSILIASISLADDIIWEFYTGGGIYTARSLPDLNSDGIDEVVCAQYYSDYDPYDIYCVDGATGTEIWSKDDCKGVWGVKSLEIIEDINSSGYSDVIMGTPGGYDPPGRCVILKEGSTGDTIWQWSAYENGWLRGWVYSVDKISDIDGDGIDDVLAGVGGWSSVDGLAVCLHSAGVNEGEVIWYYEDVGDAVNDIEPIDDINSDGYQDAIFGVGGNADDPSIHAVSGNSSGEITSTIWSTALESDVYDIEITPDLNSDGYQDMFVTCWDAYGNSDVYAISGYDGAIIWQNPTGQYPMVCDVHPDINDDGYVDMVYGYWGNSIWARNGVNGDQFWMTYVGDDPWNVHIMDDMTNDSKQDIVAGALNGSVVGFVDAVSGDLIWTSEQFGERIYDVRVADDLDSDGFRDIIVCLQDQGGEVNHLFAISADQPTIDIRFFYLNAFSKEKGVEIVWEVGEQDFTFDIYRKELSSDKKFAEGIERMSRDEEFIKLNQSPVVGSGKYTYMDEGVEEGNKYLWRVVAIEENQFEETSTVFNPSLPQSHKIYQNHPNPFADSTQISFYVSGEKAVEGKIEIYDIKGRLIEKLARENIYEPGEHSFLWECESSLKNGVYILKLTLGDDVLMSKMVHSNP